MNECIEKKRIYYLDIIRGLAVFFMIMQHCMLIFEYSEGNNTGFIGSIFILLGTAPAAPMFMLIMGIFLMKSKADNRTIFKRGIKILLAGYILNLIRFSLPAFVGGELKTGLEMFFAVDILQLAGLFYMVSILFRKLAAEHWFTPPIVVVILLLSPYLWESSIQNLFTDLLWGTNANVAFPFFPWCIYPLLGMYLSQYLAVSRIDKKHKLMMLFSIIALFTVGILTLEQFPYLDYSRYGLGASMLVIAFTFLYVLMAEYLTNYFDVRGKDKVSETIIYWSMELTNIYIVSWAIYGWSALVIGYNAYNDWLSMMFGIIVLTLSHLLVKYTGIKKLIPKI